MADIDSLSLRITSDTSDASKSIERLIASLERLNTSLNLSGGEAFANVLGRISSAINSMDGDKLGNVAKSLSTFTKSSNGLINVAARTEAATNGFSKLAREIAEMYGINDKNGIKRLQTQLEELYHTTDASGFVRMNTAIEEVVGSLSMYETEVQRTNREAREALRTMKIKLPKGWVSEYGDAISASTARGAIGFNTLKNAGIDASTALRDLNERFGTAFEIPNQEQDAFKMLVEFARASKEASSSVMTLNDAIRKGEASHSAFNSVWEHIASTMGYSAQQMVDNAMLMDDPFQGADYLTRLSNAAETMKAQGNPFGQIVEGLRELSNIELSETLLYLNTLKDVVSKVGGVQGMRAGDSMKGIASGIEALNGVAVPQFGAEMSVFTQQLRGLGTKTVVNASQSLGKIAEGLMQLKTVGAIPQIGGLTELATALSMFGRKSAVSATVTIPRIAVAFRQLIDSLSMAPLVRKDIIDLANSMANLINSSKGVYRSSRDASKGINLFGNSAKKAKKHTFSLASAIGKLYATYWMVFRGINMLGSSLTLASDLTEIQNVVDHTFGEATDRMEEFAQSSVENFGMSELTAKRVATTFQAMGRNMGVPDSVIQQTNEFVQTATSGYADVVDSMADVSINLTKLTGDMASFYNLDYEEVAEDMQAIFTGQVRPLRQYGLDLTEANLKQFALRNGMNANIDAMTNAEKTLLRYQYVMSHTTAAQGDFIRTQYTWANQVRIAREQLDRLRIVLGQIMTYTFKPLVMNFNSAMNDIISLAESTLNSLGTIFGWTVEISDVGILQDYEDGLEDIEDGYDSAGKSAKKFKNFLLGIDELNLLPDNSDSGSGSGAGSAAEGLANGIEESRASLEKTEGAFDSIYDTLYKLGKRIGEVQLDWFENIDWDDVYKSLRKFGKGFASFVNGYLSDVKLFYHQGRFFANGINAIANAIYGFFSEFDGLQLGKDLGFQINGFTRNLDWDLIKDATYEVGHDISGMVNGLFRNTNWKDVGRTLIEMINTGVLFASTIVNEIEWGIIGNAMGDALNQFFKDWDSEELGRAIKGALQGAFDLANGFLTRTDFEAIGESIGTFLCDLHLEEYADDIALLLWNLLKASFNLIVTMAEEAPLETALILAIGKYKFAHLGGVVGGNLASAISTPFAGKLTSLLTTDLATLSTSASLLGKAGAVGTAIAGAIVAAVGGYHVGLEISKKIFPEDEMWATEDAWAEAIVNFKEWPAAIREMFEDSRTSIENTQDAILMFDHSLQETARSVWGIKEGMSWSDVEADVASGKMFFSDDDIADIKWALEEYGHTATEVNNIISGLRSAKNEYNSINKLLTNTGRAMQDNHGHIAGITTAQDNWNRMQAETGNILTRGGAQLKINAQHIAGINSELFTSTLRLDAFNNAFSKMSDNGMKTKGMSDNVKEFTSKLKEVSAESGYAFMNMSDSFNEAIMPMFNTERWSQMLSGIPKAFIAMWEQALNAVKSMWSQLAQWINTTAKIEIPKVKIGKTEIGGGSVSLKIPRFEMGGAIPNTGSLFLANERGPEVLANMGSSTGIMNTDQMEMAIANGMMRAMAQGGGNVTVNLVGDASTFFTAMVKENNNSIMRTGASPLRV